MTGAGGGITTIEQPSQYCSTIWVIDSSLRQLVCGLIVTLLMGLPASVVMLTLRVVKSLLALHSCSTIASSVEALLPQVIWVVSHGAVGVVGVGSVTVCA